MKKIAIFTSGLSRGTNFKDISNYIQQNELEIKIEYVIVTNPDAPIIDIAKKLKIRFVLLDGYSKLNYQLANISEKYPVDLIVLAGFMRKLNKTFFNRIKTPVINIHPALLPKYGGKGMYGMKVHEAVFKNREKISGVTTHFVNEIYDDGKIIAQKECDISMCKSSEEVAAKVLELEHELYPKIIIGLLWKK